MNGKRDILDTITPKIPKVLRRKTYEKDFCDFEGCGRHVKRVGYYPVKGESGVVRMRTLGLQQNPRVVTYYGNAGYCGNFDEFSLIERFDLPTKGLRIVRA